MVMLMVMLSAKLTILISWSPICIPLILSLVLMKLASTSAAIMYNSMENKHAWQTHQVRVKGWQEAFYFNFRLDIGVCIFNHVNEFVSISDFKESRKVKILIYSKYITERFLFSLLDTSFIQQVGERTCKSVLFLIASD